MSLKWNKKYLTMAIYTLVVICLSIAFLRMNESKKLLDEIVAVFLPFAIGGIIAYVLNFILKIYERKIKKRWLSLALTYGSVILIGYSFLHFIIPQLSEGITNFAQEFPDYLSRLTGFVDQRLKRFNLDPEYVDYINLEVAQLIERFVDLLENTLQILWANIFTVVLSIWNLLLGVVISVYLLNQKERFCALYKKIVIAIFNEKQADHILKLTKRADRIFTRFLIGTVLTALVVGVLTTVLLWIFRVPYAILVGFILGVSNVIPFFGPIIGAIPSAIIIFFVSPLKAGVFLVLILIIQLIDANVIAPKILGESIGLPPFWILFATLVFGKAFGIMGMILGVPIFAFIYSVVKDIIEGRLKLKAKKYF